MTLHRGPLFPTDDDLCSTRPRAIPKPIKKWGPYKNVEDLLKVHIDLVSEAFIRSVREQLDKFRADAHFWESATCYSVEVKGLDGSDVEVLFDASKYVWDEERRFLFHNLVFLTQTNMQDFVIGIVIGCDKEQLKKGSAVIKLIRGVDAAGRGKFLERDAKPYLNQKFTLMESKAFFFPHLHVTNALRRDLKNAKAPLAEFHDEIVFTRSQKPPESPLYLQSSRKMRLSASDSKSLNVKFQTLQQALSSSQRDALKSVLTHRVALVQGPPGTGKTFAGCKIAEYLLELKKLPHDLLPGPILVVTTTNHSVREFLTRCCDFTNKVIHGYSQNHAKETYGPLQDQYNRDMSNNERLKLMRSADVLSMTTTRAAYTRSTLDSLQIKVVIVEEAAREMEGFVLASIPRGAEHLILLGDHKQLRPVCDNNLGHSHHLTLSLFERLINNGIACPMLNEQRRMRPEIADLIRTIYPTLTDHKSTLNRSPIEGVDLKVPVFFLDHQEREVQGIGSGYYNPWEAKMVAMLCHYLLVQGHRAEDITILVAYRKQIACICKEIEEIRGTRFGIRVCTIDGFQGEENEIVILSLVRSNPQGNIGFLREYNRACVALSRAKNGFFLVGDLKCLTASGSEVWNHVLKTVQTGGPLPLKCRHGKTIGGKSPEHFKAALCCICRVHAAVHNAQAFLDMGQDLIEKTEADLRRVDDELETRKSLPEDNETRGKLKGRLESLKKSVKNWRYKKTQAEEASEIVDVWYEVGLIHCDVTDESLQTKILLEIRGLNRIVAPSSNGMGVGFFGYMDALVDRWKPTWRNLMHEIEKYFKSP